MLESKHQPWKLFVHAKLHNFDFKLRAWRIKGARFSIVLKIRQFFLRIVAKTDTMVMNSSQKRSSKSTFSLLFDRFRARLTRPEKDSSSRKSKSYVQKDKSDSSNDKSNSLPHEHEELMMALTGNLGLFSNAVALRDYVGIVINAFTIFFYLILLFRRYLTRKVHFLMASMASSVAFYLSYLNYKDLVSVPIWKAWNHVVSFGCLYLLTQVIFFRLSIFMKRTRLVGFLISAALPLSQLTLGLNKHTMSVITAWMASTLLACQTFFDVLGNPKDPKALAFFASSVHCLLKESANLLIPFLTK